MEIIRSDKGVRSGKECLRYILMIDATSVKIVKPKAGAQGDMRGLKGILTTRCFLTTSVFRTIFLQILCYHGKNQV